MVRSGAHTRGRVAGRLLFASYHCLIDPSSGAAISARTLLPMLGQRGWEARAFCGPRLDFQYAESPEQLLCDQRIAYAEQAIGSAGLPCRLLEYAEPYLAGTIFVPDAPPRRWASPEEAGAFLDRFATVLAKFHPDVVLTYGGSALTLALMQRARQCGAQVVFWLQNLAYNERRLFEPADAVIVPSQYAAAHYRRALGLEPLVLPCPLEWQAIKCRRTSGRQFVTFVNPEPAKGVFVFARLAAELARRRPDIPLLIVEGRSGAEWLEHTGVDLSACGNLHRMRNTPDARDFYRASRVVLMPSLCGESFGRVAAEAMINGIPVLGSRRGALIELLDGAGLLFEVPEQYAPASRAAPSAEEVAPWIEAILRLWDDEPFYEEVSRRCRERAEAWREDTVARQYDAVLGRLCAGFESRISIVTL